jgi:hypothetical protein
MKKDLMSQPDNIKETLALLDIHYKSFIDVKNYAEKYGHPHPCDTRAWSQIIISALTGIKGIERKKGSDFDDGSDVKGANTWGAIDTPRFNGCLKAGTKSNVSGKVESLDDIPYLFFVLWDYEPPVSKERCRVWVVRPQKDKIFRSICNLWYEKRASGEIISNNFQLHPPRHKNSNIIRNTCGNLEYPLLFSAVREKDYFMIEVYDPDAMKRGQCKIATE